MKLSVRQLLENKGFTVKEEHIDMLEQNWEGIKNGRQMISQELKGEADLGLRNIAGGDHVD